MASSEVRQRLLDAGVSVLEAQGFAALTQPRVAKAAGVSQSHLTYYFPTRGELLLAIAEYSVDQAIGGTPAAPPADPLKALATSVAYLPRVRMMLGLMAAADQDAQLRPAVTRLIAHVRASVAKMLDRIGCPAEPPQVLVFHAAVAGLAVLNLGRQSAHSRAEIEQGLGQLLALLAADECRGRS